jgi:hypothetical protein
LAPSPTKSAATGRALVASSLSRRTHARECRLRHDAAHVSSLTLPQQAQAPACQGATRRAVVTSKVTVVKQEQSLSSNSTSHLCGVSSHLGQPDWLSAVGSPVRLRDAAPSLRDFSAPRVRPQIERRARAQDLLTADTQSDAYFPPAGWFRVHSGLALYVKFNTLAALRSILCLTFTCSTPPVPCDVSFGPSKASPCGQRVRAWRLNSV